MADSFATQDSEYEYHIIRKEIRDRTVECEVPRCWPLKENDNGQMYIDRHMNKTEGPLPKGRHVQIRRFLFLREFGFVPPRRRLTVRPTCESRCVNPYHTVVRTWNPQPEQIKRGIKKGWLSAKDAAEWYLGTERKTKKT